MLKIYIFKFIGILVFILNVLLISCSSICVSPFTEDFYSSTSSVCVWDCVCVFVNHLKVCVDVGALRLPVTIHLALLCANFVCQNKLQCGPNLISQRPGHIELFWSKPYQSNTSKYISQKSCKTNYSLILYKPLICWKHIMIAITPLTYSTHVSSCFVERFEQQETFTMHTRHPYELLNKTLLAKQILQLFVFISLCLSIVCSKQHMEVYMWALQSTV